jgi:hypothetical protein
MDSLTRIGRGHKEREENHVIAVEARQVCGLREALEDVLAATVATRRVNTPFMEPQHRTDRDHNARKARSSYRFGKHWQVHQATGYPTL